MQGCNRISLGCVQDTRTLSLVQKHIQLFYYCPYQQVNVFFYMQVLNWHPILNVILRLQDMNKKLRCVYTNLKLRAVCSRIRYCPVVHSLNEVPLHHPTGGTWQKAVNFSSFIHSPVSSVVLFLMFFLFLSTFSCTGNVNVSKVVIPTGDQVEKHFSSVEKER